ncbi:MAG: ATP-binding protein [Prevotella sp.]|nr:ATP-binding protein [Prevotella sp.]
MISKEIIKSVLASNQDSVRQFKIIPRGIPSDEYKQTVFVGVRRSGKSFMLYQKIQDLLNSGFGWDNMLYVNFEDERLNGFSSDDFERILDCHREMYGKRPMLFLDEIQNIEGWEKFARRMADNQYFIWITGSNQKMLSKDIQARLGGRYTTKEVYPYSFKEYLDANDIHLSETSFYNSDNKAQLIRFWNSYLYGGGMPHVAQLPLNNPYRNIYLQDTYGKVYLNDIANRTGISAAYYNHLRLLLRKMAESVLQPDSYANFRRALSSVSGNISPITVAAYINGCEDAWLILRLRNIASHFSEKETSCKYYFIDNGFLNMHLLDGKSSLLENTVALALFRKYGHDADNQRVFFYNKNIEVDFYIPEDELAIQVAYTIYGSQNTYNREVDALTKFENFKPGCKRMILTNDEEGLITDKHGEIEVKPFWKWSLEQDVKQTIGQNKNISIAKLGELREKITLMLIERASDRSDSCLSEEFKGAINEYTALVPTEDLKIHLESLWRKAKAILDADGVSYHKQEDTHQELLDIVKP